MGEYCVRIYCDDGLICYFCCCPCIVLCVPVSNRHLLLRCCKNKYSVGFWGSLRGRKNIDVLNGTNIRIYVCYKMRVGGLEVQPCRNRLAQFFIVFCDFTLLQILANHLPGGCHLQLRGKLDLAGVLMFCKFLFDVL